MGVVEVDGATTRVWRQGQGRPVVYLHSGFAEIGDLPFLEVLSGAGLAVVAPELPGFGNSDALASPQRVEDVVFHLRRLLDTLGVYQPVLIGSSLGGWLAAEVAVWFPERISALVLIDAWGIKLAGEELFDIFSCSNHELWSRAFPDGGDLVAYLGPVLEHCADGPESLRLHLFKAAEGTARIGWNPYLHNPRLAARLAALAVPTLVVWGEADQVAPLAYGQAFAAAIPAARLEVISGAGHVPVLDHPGETAAVVTEFLSQEPSVA